MTIKTIYIHPIFFRITFKACLLFFFISCCISAQTSNLSNITDISTKSAISSTNKDKKSNNEKWIKDITTDDEKAKIQNNDNKNIWVVTDNLTNEKPIEINLNPGKINSQDLIIKNTGDSPLMWNFVEENSDNLLFRLYRKDRDLVEAMLPYGKGNNDAVSFSVYRTEKKISETADTKNLPVKSFPPAREINSYSQEYPVNSNQLVNLQVINYSSVHSNEVELTDQKNNFKNETENSIKDLPGLIDNKDISHQLEIQQNKDADEYSGDQVHLFLQWYKFEECGYPEFKPRGKVWEVSSDNGDHWQQIFNINGESYIVNAQCFNPVEFLQKYNTGSQNSSTSKLTTLQEFMKQTQSGPLLSPGSGIIAAKDSAKIEFSLDATKLQNGTLNTSLELIDPVSMKTMNVIPVKLIVNQKTGSLNPGNQLLKQAGDEQLPDKFELSQNFPNPFNPLTKIKYAVPLTSNVELSIFNILGEQVQILVNEIKETGFYTINFDASRLSSGVYFYHISAIAPGSGQNFTETKKMILLK